MPSTWKLPEAQYLFLSLESNVKKWWAVESSPPVTGITSHYKYPGYQASEWTRWGSLGSRMEMRSIKGWTPSETARWKSGWGSIHYSIYTVTITPEKFTNDVTSLIPASNPGDPPPAGAPESCTATFGMSVPTWSAHIATWSEPWA